MKVGQTPYRAKQVQSEGVTQDVGCEAVIVTHRPMVLQHLATHIGKASFKACESSSQSPLGGLPTFGMPISFIKFSRSSSGHSSSSMERKPSSAVLGFMIIREGANVEARAVLAGDGDMA